MNQQKTPPIFRQYLNIRLGHRTFLLPEVFAAIMKADPKNIADLDDDIDKEGNRQEYLQENGKFVKIQESIFVRAKNGTLIGNTVAAFPQVSHAVVSGQTSIGADAKSVAKSKNS